MALIWLTLKSTDTGPSCLAKCKQRLRNIFVTSSSKVTINQKRKMGQTNIRVSTFFSWDESGFLEAENKVHKVFKKKMSLTKTCP